MKEKEIEINGEKIKIALKLPKDGEFPRNILKEERRGKNQNSTKIT